MSYMEVQPYGEIDAFRLSIVRDSLEVVPDVNISITDLNRNNTGVKYKHFFNTGDGGITFKCTVVIKKGIHDYPTVINNLYKDSNPVTITTDAIDVPNDTYLITKNPKRKQTSEQYTQWEMEFTTYKELTIWKYANDNSAVKKALSKAKNDKTKSKKKKSTATFGGLETAVAGCTVSSFKYSKTKKSTECVKTLQKLLRKYNVYLNKPIDGWYGKDTMDAVKKYQKKVGLKATGKMDNKTFTYIRNGITTNETGVAPKGKVVKAKVVKK